MLCLGWPGPSKPADLPAAGWSLGCRSELPGRGAEALCSCLSALLRGCDSCSRTMEARCACCDLSLVCSALSSTCRQPVGRLCGVGVVACVAALSLACARPVLDLSQAGP